jgi:hypothetical protein
MRRYTRDPAKELAQEIEEQVQWLRDRTEESVTQKQVYVSFRPKITLT